MEKVAVTPNGEQREIFIYGAGGHGRAVAEAVRREGRYRIVCVIDDNVDRPSLAGVPWRGSHDVLPELAAENVTAGIVAIGNNADREHATQIVEQAGLELVTVVDPSAVVALDVPIGDGSVLLPFSFAGASSRIGRGVILNTSATADHDCVIGDFAHVSVGAHLAGGCRIGARSLVGIGAVLGRPVTVGERAIVGAGSAVLHDVPDAGVVAGVPARDLSVAP
jgi:sugar O-acyltransferase (sialic acid O-acetyltransferase NeuD family)